MIQTIEQVLITQVNAAKAFVVFGQTEIAVISIVDSLIA